MKGDHEGEEIQKSKDNVYERDYFFLGGESYYIRHNHNNHIYLSNYLRHLTPFSFAVKLKISN